MKWLKRIGIGVAILVALPVLGLAAAGLRPGAGINDASVYVDRPPAEVFAWLRDGDNALRWVGGLTALEPLDEGELRVGFRQHAIVEMDGERIVLLMECTALREGEAVEWHVSNADPHVISFDEDVIQEVIPEDGGARFHTRGVTDYHGVIATLLEPLISASADEKLAQDLARFAELAEADIEG